MCVCALCRIYAKDGNICTKFRESAGRKKGLEQQHKTKATCHLPCLQQTSRSTAMFRGEQDTRFWPEKNSQTMYCLFCWHTGDALPSTFVATNLQVLGGLRIVCKNSYLMQILHKIRMCIQLIVHPLCR
jgi:hypothetical protein